MTMKESKMQGIDIVSDIHGHATELHSLLRAMDYIEKDGVYIHPERTILFLGDFIDRGDEQIEVLRVATAMIKSGTAKAVMGNHEYNAIGWAPPDKHGDYLRSHKREEHHTQHSAFLSQVVEGSELYYNLIAWFKTLPVFIEERGVRAIHACWHDQSIKDLRSCLSNDGCFTEEGFIKSHSKGTPFNKAVEVLLKGPEVTLEPEFHFYDKDGHLRKEARIRWWDKTATDLKSGAIGIDLSKTLNADALIKNCSDYHYHDEVPLFFGHYWLTGKPIIESNNALCLDYSVAKGGSLIGYRWSPGTPLNSGDIVSIRSI